MAIPKSKGWDETTYDDPIPASNLIRINRRTARVRFARCHYLLRRGGGIYHEPGGKVIDKRDLDIIAEMIVRGDLVEDGPAGSDLPDATRIKFTVSL